MRLSCGGGESLRIMSALREAIVQRRWLIRYHRDQRLDDRCWLDDYLVWAMCDDSPAKPLTPPPFEEAMEKCHLFYQFRRAQDRDPAPLEGILQREFWDQDLARMTADKLIDELEKIQTAIRRHRDVKGRPRTVDDDRLLYSVLPEKIPADFRLPPEEDFLGKAKAPHAGCPAFWQSHDACPNGHHDLHRWGPCR